MQAPPLEVYIAALFKSVEHALSKRAQHQRSSLVGSIGIVFPAQDGDQPAVFPVEHFGEVADLREKVKPLWEPGCKLVHMSERVSVMDDLRRLCVTIESTQEAYMLMSYIRPDMTLTPPTDEKIEGHYLRHLGVLD